LKIAEFQKDGPRDANKKRGISMSTLTPETSHVKKIKNEWDEQTKANEEMQKG